MSMSNSTEETKIMLNKILKKNSNALMSGNNPISERPKTMLKQKLVDKHQSLLSSKGFLTNLF